MLFKNVQSHKGLSLVGVLVTIAIAVTVFTALYSATIFSLRLTVDSSTRLFAMSLATERMEYFRSLSYDDVGTVSGFPAGVIPQNRTVVLNGVTFNERVLVDYIDDPADNVSGVDSNGIITDYKKIKIEISWAIRGETDSVSYVSNIVPVSVETNAGGGAVNVEVNDADGSPLQGAVVRITNDSLSPAVDITRNTGPTGLASFIVPAGSGYHASATAPLYSADKTYEVSPSNTNPSPGSFTVVESLITDQGFKIGELSDIEINVFSDISDASSTVSFFDSADISASSSVVLNAGRLELEENLGVYEPSGNVVLKQIVPTSLEKWESAVIVGGHQVNTDYRIHFYSGTTTDYDLLDEADLPGNAAGFNVRIIDLSSLDVSEYPDLTLEIELTSDTADTPWVDDIAVYYRESDIAQSNVDLTVRSKKTIGTSPDVYKNEEDVTSDSGGLVQLLDMEFDEEYTIFNNDSLTLTRACSNADLDFDQADVLLNHQAGINSELDLVFDSTPADTLLVTVNTILGEPIPGAMVSLSRSGFSETLSTDACGQAFFKNTDGAETDYVLEITRIGYSDYTNSPLEISGNTRWRTVLSEI